MNNIAVIKNIASDDIARESIRSLSARAPAKLIISGEHAVVYGFPSLAMAIDLYAISDVTRNKNNLLGFDFANLKYNAKHTLHTLGKLKDKALLDYQRFLRGECSIREVVNKPFELLQFALSIFLDKLNIVLPGGLDIKTESSIPSGCGLGSSAATIMSVLYAVGNLLELDITKPRYIELGKSAENLQHGKSSGVDITLAVEGGCIKFQDGSINRLDIATSNMYLINTGRPVVSTGECVSKVKKHFKVNSSNRGKNIGYDFAELTTSLEQELVKNNIEQTILLIRENNKLLCHIGIVPDRVRSFIAQIDKLDCAAKVCGAGAVSGDSAGAVLALCSNKERFFALKELTNKFGYSIQQINVDGHGIQVL